MEILFVALGGAILGISARYVLPRRERYGVALLPCWGASVASVAWVILTWLGWAWNGGLIWWVSFIVAGASSAGLAVLLGTRRERHDEERFLTLSGGRSPLGV